MDNGFITLQRKITKWEWYDDIPTCRLFIHLLLVVNHEDREWHGITIRRGQKLTSYEKLAKETGLSVRSVRTAINHLKSTGEVTCKSTHRYTLVTVEKYDDYQSEKKRKTRQMTRKVTSERQAADTVPTTNNNDNNDNNDNKKQKDLYGGLPSALVSSLHDFEDMRRRIKAPMTDRAEELLIKKLIDMSKSLDGTIDTTKAVEILEQSTMNGWKSVYPLKQEKKHIDVMDIDF